MGAAPMANLDVEYFDNVPLARPRGDIDASNAAYLRDDLRECLRPGADELVLDLGAVGYVDSAGIDMLFRLAGRLGERRAVLRLVITRGSQLDRLADIVGLRGAIAVYDNVEDARGAVGQEAPGPGPLR
jgi:anti-anti-sigma factor